MIRCRELRRRTGAVLVLLLLALLRHETAATPADSATRARFFRLLHAGDSVYAQRSGYGAIARSLPYFERAYTLAEAADDTLLLAEAIFAKGRVYDAWNREPQRTIAYFRQAATLFGRYPAAWQRYYYARYLLVHAYDKVPDTLGTVRAARALYHELRALPAARRRQIPTTVELAWSCTEVGAFALADSVVAHLVRRADVRNDPTSYDHLTHYYLVKARAALHYRHLLATPYLDSLRREYRRMPTLFDRAYYSRELAKLYAVAGQYARAYEHLEEHRRYFDTLAGASSVAELRLAVLTSAEREALARRRAAAAERRRRQWVTGALAAALLLGAGLTAYFYWQYRRNRAQARALAEANHALDEKVTQVELLNKEIQHRVKNNLHMVFSLLQMQERRATDDEVIEHLQAARLRVESIAALHNQLLGQPTGFDLGPYLRSLITNVVGCLANDKQVITHLRTDALHLSERAYLPLSLILNEWVTNSIKYAEPPAGAPLEITVEVRQTPADVCVTYTDSGTATAPGTPGLGSQLIALLSRQLGATLTRPPGRPFAYELCIPHPPPTPSVTVTPDERKNQRTGR